MNDLLPKDFNAEVNGSDYDLDLFLYDSTKIIHIATAGMILINSLTDINGATYNDNYNKVLAYRRTFEIKTIENLDRDNLTEVEDYVYFFNLMAKRGFYSYDKLNIDIKNDYKFQLISNPIYNRRITINGDNEIENNGSQRILDYELNLIRAKKLFPTDSKVFDLSEYI